MPTKRNWKELLAQFHASGLTQAEFSKQHGIPTNTLTYNLKKAREEGKIDESSDFVQVGGCGIEKIEIQGSGGTLIRIPGNASLETMRTVIQALKN